MATTVTFIKQSGEIQNVDALFQHFVNAVSTLRNGKYVIRIEKDVQRRTVDQNALMWLWFTCIEDETGTNKQDVHDYYCARFLNRQVSFKDEPSVTVSGSTSRLNTVSMSHFLDQVQADVASEFGIRLPNPDDIRWQDFYERYKHMI
ncbi:MAG: hypothetical protein LBS54_04285 [Dysgonamonadaceae bacterium]|jgi:hypothetical protein|nr:hypothetical protein [Dysgonamonadaceae bacterium]